MIFITSYDSSNLHIQQLKQFNGVMNGKNWDTIQYLPSITQSHSANILYHGSGLW